MHSHILQSQKWTHTHLYIHAKYFMHIHTCTLRYMYLHTCTLIQTYIRTVHTCTCTLIQTYIHARRVYYIHVYTCIHTYMRICLHSLKYSRMLKTIILLFIYLFISFLYFILQGWPVQLCKTAFQRRPAV